MTRQLSWLVLIVRFALSIHVIAAAVAVLSRALPTSGEPAWVPVHAGARLDLYAVLLLAAGTATALGIHTRRAATVIASVLVAIVIESVIVDPLHNTMNHLVPLIVESMIVIVLADRSVPFGLDLWVRPTPAPDEVSISSLVVLARVFLGAVFIAQGAAGAFHVGPVAFAREVYVEPLADSWVPAPLLWAAGVTNPIIQLIGGTLFVLGLFTRATAVALGMFLCSILFGHVLSDPFDRGPDVHSYALANLGLVLIVLALATRGNRYSVDALIRCVTRSSEAAPASCPP